MGYSEGGGALSRSGIIATPEMLLHMEEWSLHGEVPSLRG